MRPLQRASRAKKLVSVVHPHDVLGTRRLPCLRTIRIVTLCFTVTLGVVLFAIRWAAANEKISVATTHPNIVDQRSAGTLISMYGTTQLIRLRELPSGRLAYDGVKLTRDGKTTTQIIGMPSGRLKTETWEDYEQRVLKMPHATFGSVLSLRDTRIDKLDKSFRWRLRLLLLTGRIVGHPFVIVEGCRSISRQEWLFRIGRVDSSELPVTWTLTSSHVSCRAADLEPKRVVTESFAWLAAVAPMFGLRSLGPGDPGHVFIATDD